MLKFAFILTVPLSVIMQITRRYDKHLGAISSISITSDSFARNTPTFARARAIMSSSSSFLRIYSAACTIPLCPNQSSLGGDKGNTSPSAFRSVSTSFMLKVPRILITIYIYIRVKGTREKKGRNGRDRKGKYESR